MKNTENAGGFSRAIKGEMCPEHLKDCCVMAELAGAVFACGSLVIDANGPHITFATESMAFAKRLLNTLRDVLKLDADAAVTRGTLQKRRVYTIKVPDGRLFLRLIGADAQNVFCGAPQSFLTQNECCKEAALRGAFLGCGTVSDPKRGYRFEFVTKNEAFAEYLQSLLEYFSIASKKVRRKQRYVVYLSEGDAVCALMSKMGAYGAILNFENVRILKETRNNVNRAVNCVTANIGRTITSALRQVESINAIDAAIGLDALPEKLREACHLRLENRDASLRELCELAGATKSAMNHRFRKIGEIANSLKGG